MKDLEKSFQDSFKNFEPEVRPEVWQKLESSLNAAGSVAAGSKAAVSGAKGLAIKASTWVWIAAASLSASIGAAVYFNSDKQDIKPAVENVVVSEEAPVQENNIIQNVPVENTSSDIKGGAEISAASASNQLKISAGSDIQEEMTSSSTEHNPVNTTTPSATSSNPSTTSESDQRLNQQTEARNETHKTDDATTLDKDIPTSIIIKSTCGFAPFKVTALLNKEDLSGTWDFGDGHATAKSNTASNTYNRPGVYEIQCEIAGQKLTRTIEVIGNLVTAFSPNGDGQNDEFFIDGANLSEITLKIFNRTGKLEYEMTDPGQRWDGKDENGQELPKGTYFYDIFARSKNGQTINQKGTINLFR